MSKRHWNKREQEIREEVIKEVLEICEKARQYYRLKDDRKISDFLNDFQLELTSKIKQMEKGEK